MFGLWLGVSVGYIESRARRVWNDYVMNRNLSMTGTALIEAVDVQGIAPGSYQERFVRVEAIVADRASPWLYHAFIPSLYLILLTHV